MEEARNIVSVAIDQSKEQKRGYSGSTERAKESPLCYIDAELEQSTKCTKDESCSVVTL